MDAEYELDAKRIERNVLEVELDEEELWEYERYQRLRRQIAELEELVESDESTAEDRRGGSVVVEAGD
jgi:hypothetical protein